MNYYETLTEAIDALRKEGYTEDFNLKENCLQCREGRFKIFHDEFHIDKFYRFEGMTDPADQAILYAISSPAHSLKGLLVSAYGIYADSITNEMTEKLNITN
jgi:hypothetical protein